MRSSSFVLEALTHVHEHRNQFSLEQIERLEGIEMVNCKNRIVFKKKICEILPFFDKF